MGTPEEAYIRLKDKSKGRGLLRRVGRKVFKAFRRPNTEERSKNDENAQDVVNKAKIDDLALERTLTVDNADTGCECVLHGNDGTNKEPNDDEPSSTEENITDDDSSTEDDILVKGKVTVQDVSAEAKDSPVLKAPVQDSTVLDAIGQDYPASATAPRTKRSDQLEDHIGCALMPGALWNRLTCGAIDLELTSPQCAQCVDQEPGTSVESVVTLQSRESSGSLAWLGSPADEEEDDIVVEALQNSPISWLRGSADRSCSGLGSDPILQHRVESPILSFSFGEPSSSLSQPPPTPSRTVEGDAQQDPLELSESRSIDMDPVELARRQIFKEHLRLSSQRLIQEQEEEVKTEIETVSIDISDEAPNDVMQLMHRLPLTKQRASFNSKKVESNDTEELTGKGVGKQETVCGVQDEEAKKGSVTTEASASVGDEEDEEEEQEREKEKEEQDELTLNDDFFNEDIDDFHFDANFSELEEQGGTMKDMGGKSDVAADRETDESKAPNRGVVVSRENECDLSGEEQKRPDNENSDGFGNAGDDDTALVETIVRELEELQEFAMAETRLNPPPPPPPSAPTSLLQPVGRKSREDRYSVEEETSITVETAPSSLMTEFATLLSSHNDITHAKLAHNKEGAADSGRRGRARSDPPARTTFVTHEEDCIKPTITRQSLSLLGGTKRSNSEVLIAGHEEARKGKNKGVSYRELSSFENSKLPEEDRIFAGGTEEHIPLILVRSRSQPNEVLSFQKRFKDRPDVPCEEIFVKRKSIIRTMSDNTNITGKSKKRVAFDLGEDVHSLASVSTQGLSIVPYKDDIFYVCAGENAASNVASILETSGQDFLKEVDKYIDELAGSSEDESTSVISNDDYYFSW